MIKNVLLNVSDLEGKSQERRKKSKRLLLGNIMWNLIWRAKLMLTGILVSSILKKNNS